MIKKVIRSSENKMVVLVLKNKKETTRKLKISNYNELLYFVYKKHEYFLKNLHLENIYVVDDN